MCRSMVDIHSAIAEIRRGNKKEEENRKKQDENIMVCPITYGDHNNPSTGYIVSIFTVGINSKSFPWPAYSVQETSPNFLRRRTRVDGTADRPNVNTNRRQPVTIDY